MKCIVSLLVLLALWFAPETESAAAPIKYMCDMCEVSFWHCIIKCNMEEYLTRHSYNR